MKILFVCPDLTDPTAFYRSSGIAHDLEDKSGHEITTIQWNQVPVHWQIICNYDVIMMQRPFTKVAADLCLYAKAMNRPVWVDYDDNLFCLNPENKAFNIYNDPATQENVKNCLKAADVVSVPTEYLRQYYSVYNQNIQLIPNAFNDNIFKRGILKKRENTVIWRGPESHIYDLMSFGREINRFVGEFPVFEFLFMGFYPWFLSETKNKGYLPGLDIILYFNKLVDLAPTVLHVPLHDDMFNRCRSNVAFLEATFAGAVTICPGWWNLPGTVPYDDPASYYEAMRSVLAGEIDVVAYNLMAWGYIQDCLRLSQINVLRLNLLKGLI